METQVANASLVKPAGLPQLSDKAAAFCAALMSNGGAPGTRTALCINAGTNDAAYANACLRARQDVRERLDELTRLAAQASVIDRTVLLQDDELATADPGEVSRVVTEPCPACWTDSLMAVALDAAAAPQHRPSRSPRRMRPCRGRGVQRVVITPTHELRGAARRHAGRRPPESRRQHRGPHG